MDDRYRDRRQAIERFFMPENQIAGSSETFRSPDGRYELEICLYSAGPESWNYSRGIVRRLADQAIVADVRRNYGIFWHTWLQHPSGDMYFLCSEDYQGYSVINLDLGTSQVFFPEAGYEGWGFCWTAVYPSPDGLVLAVDGCYWGCPYEMVFFDFSDPTHLPLAEIGRCSDIADPVIGWVDNQAFVLTAQVDDESGGAEPQNQTLPGMALTKRVEWKRA